MEPVSPSLWGDITLSSALGPPEVRAEGGVGWKKGGAPP